MKLGNWLFSSSGAFQPFSRNGRIRHIKKGALTLEKNYRANASSGKNSFLLKFNHAERPHGRSSGSVTTSTCVRERFGALSWTAFPPEPWRIFKRNKR